MTEARPSRETSRLRVGFLHLGDPQHGVRRYGHMLAREAERRVDLRLIEDSFSLSGRWHEDAKRIDQCIERLSAAEVVHMQYNRAVWGDDWYQLRALRRFLTRCRAAIVCNLHDVYLDDPWAAWREPDRSLAKRWKRLRTELRQRVPSRRALRMLARRCRVLSVCFECERERVPTFARGAEVRVVGHFVERRDHLPDRDPARRALGVDGRRVLTLLGFLHRRKGADLLVEALPLLPSDHLVVLAGAPSEGNEKWVAKLKKRAAELGLSDRLIVTGYLDDEDQQRWMAATDVALCPFRFLSASGSIATWLSVGQPILCHDVPQVAEYERISPGAFTTFAPYTVDALVAAIEALPSRPVALPHPSVDRLRERFSITRVVDQYAAIYHEIAGGA